MGKVNYYGYVGRPYEQVRTLLGRDPVGLFQKATSSGATRARQLYVALRAGDGITMEVDVNVHIDRTREGQPVDGQPDLTCTCLELSWKSATKPSLFPQMQATLSAWPVTASETQIVLEGRYEPPMGPIGAAVNYAVGHRIAEASVHRFLDEVIDQIGRSPA